MPGTKPSPATLERKAALQQAAKDAYLPTALPSRRCAGGQGLAHFKSVHAPCRPFSDPEQPICDKRTWTSYGEWWCEHKPMLEKPQWNIKHSTSSTSYWPFGKHITCVTSGPVESDDAYKLDGFIMKRCMPEICPPKVQPRLFEMHRSTSMPSMREQIPRPEILLGSAGEVAKVRLRPVDPERSMEPVKDIHQRAEQLMNARRESARKAPQHADKAFWHFRNLGEPDGPALGPGELPPGVLRRAGGPPTFLTRTMPEWRLPAN